jgi:hypothetical protein
MTVSCRRSASWEVAETGAGDGKAALAQPCDRFQQLPARTERQTQRCQIGLAELRQHLGVDLVVAEGRHIALEAQTLQPRLYVHAVILGSEERHLHLFKDIILPVDLPAAALK